MKFSDKMPPIEIMAAIAYVTMATQLNNTDPEHTAEIERLKHAIANAWTDMGTDLNQLLEDYKSLPPRAE